VALERGRPRPWAGRAANPAAPIQFMYVPYRRSVWLVAPIERRRTRLEAGEVSQEFAGVLFPKDDLYPHSLVFPGGPPLPALDGTSVGVGTTTGSLVFSVVLDGTSVGTSGELFLSPTMEFPGTDAYPSVGDRGTLQATFVVGGTSTGSSATRGTFAKLFPQSSLYPGADVYPDTPTPNSSIAVALTGTTVGTSATTGTLPVVHTLAGSTVGVGITAAELSGGTGGPPLRVVQSNLQLA
jgi:hypothetical protein